MPVELSAAEQELIENEASAFAMRTEKPSTRDIYQQLAEKGGEGIIPDDLLTAAGELLQLGLASGRIRAVYGAHTEMAAVRLFQKTPQGQQLNRQVEEANQALKVLKDQPIEEISFFLRGPGLYGLRIKTAGCQLTTLLGPSGIDVRSLEISI